jgi:hypothetical protein
MHIDFLGLHAFVAIAERGSFRRAAAHHLIPPCATRWFYQSWDPRILVRLMASVGRIL